jgi:hypothetical protein
MASQTLRTLKLSLLADVSEFGKGMGKATSDFDKFSKNVATASKSPRASSASSVA